jgi:hypothetical protein
MNVRFILILEEIDQEEVACQIAKEMEIETYFPSDDLQTSLNADPNDETPSEDDSQNISEDRTQEKTNGRPSG